MIGIIAAMEEELTILQEKMGCEEPEIICGLSFYEGSIDGKNIILSLSGVGKVNAAMAATILIDHYGCQFIINTGIAGGIYNVSTKDIILGSRLYYSDVDVQAFGYALGQIPGMPEYYTPHPETVLQIKKALKRLNLSYKEAFIYSGDTFVSSLSQLPSIEPSLVCVAEMEGAAIAQACLRSNVEFIVLRYVSDIVGKESQIADYQHFESDMAQQSAKICLEILRNLE